MLAAPLYASQVAHTTPSENHLTDRTVIDGEPTDVVSLEGIPIGPTWEGSYLLGADENGRDLAVRLLYGARTTLVIGFGAVLLTLLLSVPLGLAAGYLGGRTDALISRLLDLLWSFPALLLGVLLSTAISLSGAQIGPVTIDPGTKLIPVVVIGLVYVPYMTRPLRGQVMALRGQPFVEAARAAGDPTGEADGVGAASPSPEHDRRRLDAAVRERGGARGRAHVPWSRGQST